MRPLQLHWGRWPPVGRRELGRLFQDSGAWLGPGSRRGEVLYPAGSAGGLPRGGGGTRRAVSTPLASDLRADIPEVNQGAIAHAPEGPGEVRCDVAKLGP